MARNNDDMLMEDELAAAFFNNDEDDATTTTGEQEPAPETANEPSETGEDDGWENTDEFPGQLAVDVYETADRLVVKARTAGVKKSDLNVSISEGILTISGVLNGGEDEHTTRWHIQECYWGEFSRTIALPVQVKENDVEAELRDGVLTISFGKEKTAAPTIIKIS